VAIKKAGMSTVALLGTRYTMELDFYRNRLEKEHGLKVLIPEEPGRTAVHDIIYRELAFGDVRNESRRAYVGIIEDLKKRGAQGVILGCTEIPLLVKEKDSPLPTSNLSTSRAKISASRESSRCGNLRKIPAWSIPPSVTRRCRCGWKLTSLVSDRARRFQIHISFGAAGLFPGICGGISGCLSL
jgi:hypothetical protein